MAVEWQTTPPAVQVPPNVLLHAEKSPFKQHTATAGSSPPAPLPAFVAAAKEKETGPTDSFDMDCVLVPATNTDTQEENENQNYRSEPHHYYLRVPARNVQNDPD